MNPVFYLPVRGTHELNDESNWARFNSTLRRFLRTEGLLSLDTRARDPFVWTTNLNVSVNQRDWGTAGANLFAYLVPPLDPRARWPAAQTRILTHSHGLQAALWAAALGLKVDVLFDVAGPVRADMANIAVLARRNIRRWVHVYSDHTDKWQWLGELGDGHFGIVRRHPLADRNVKLPGVGHTGLLNDPNDFHLWTDNQLIDELKGLVPNGDA